MFLVIKQKKKEKKRLECQINWCDTTHFDCHAQCLKTKRGHKNSALILVGHENYPNVPKCTDP